MASESEPERHRQPPAQDEEPTLTGPRHDDSSAAVAHAGSPARHAVVTGPAPSLDLHVEPEPESERAALFGDNDNDNASEASIPSDGASEQVVSPSVSTPPFWSHSHAQHLNQLTPHAPGHTRGVSTASAESVLPPGAITLQDNEREDDDEYTGRRSNSSELNGRDRNRACWARSVQVTDYVLVNGSTTNIGAFAVWNIRVETLNERFNPMLLGGKGFSDFSRVPA
jgi:hypothetical protein